MGDDWGREDRTISSKKKKQEKKKKRWEFVLGNTKYS